jgi:hypothetical protein
MRSPGQTPQLFVSLLLVTCRSFVPTQNANPSAPTFTASGIFAHLPFGFYGPRAPGNGYTGQLSGTESGMNSGHRSAAQRALAATRRHGWLAAAVLLICCGGKSLTTQTSDAVGVGGTKPDAAGGSSWSGSPAAGGTALATGGVAYDGGDNITVSLGGAADEYGCPSPGAGAAGAEEESCDGDALLFTAIVDGATGGLGGCQFVPPPGPAEKFAGIHGAVIIDSTGRVIDNTGLLAGYKQTWFDQLCNRRWPCLAGMTLYYECTNPD